MTEQHYLRPLPAGQVAFASPEGRALFREAWDGGTAEVFFALMQQFHTQADPAFCGPASLVMCLNALGIDPGRLWRGPWRWFSEELLDCCAPLEKVREGGITLDQLACLARCNGAESTLERPNAADIQRFRELVRTTARRAEDPSLVIVSYSRRALGQTGGGHFSPIGAYNAERDLVLILDVARFKYPPHWVPLAALYGAMLDTDPDTGRQRGWVTLRRAQSSSKLRYLLSCREGLKVGATLDELIASTRRALLAACPHDAGSALSVAIESALASDLSRSFVLRTPETAEHVQLLAALQTHLRATLVYERARQHGGPVSDLAVAWLLTAPLELWADLPPTLARELERLVAPESVPADLASELAHVRSQVEFVLRHARESGSSPASRNVPAGLA